MAGPGCSGAAGRRVWAIGRPEGVQNHEAPLSWGRAHSHAAGAAQQQQSAQACKSILQRVYRVKLLCKTPFSCCRLSHTPQSSVGSTGMLVVNLEMLWQLMKKNKS